MSKDSVYDWSSTAADNTDIGGISMQGTAAVSNFDNGFRTLMGQIADWTDQDTIASGGTTDLSTVPGMYVSVTGTTTITGLGTLKAGAIKYLKFAGVLTLTHNATSLILPGGVNITTAAGDVAMFVSEGSGNWRCAGYQRASGEGVRLATAVASTSGVSVGFAGIPAGAKRVNVHLMNVSTSGSSLVLVQIGDGSGLKGTGYVGTVGITTASSATTVNTLSSGFQLVSADAAAQRSGTLRLDLIDTATNAWVANGVVGDHSGTNSAMISGYNTLASALTQIQVLTANGVDTFDSGTINVSWEI